MVFGRCRRAHSHPKQTNLLLAPVPANDDAFLVVALADAVQVLRLKGGEVRGYTLGECAGIPIIPGLALRAALLLRGRRRRLSLDLHGVFWRTVLGYMARAKKEYDARTSSCAWVRWTWRWCR